MPDVLGFPGRKDPMAFLVYKERLARRGLKEDLEIKERQERQVPPESQVFLVTSVSQERGGLQDPEE